MLHSAESGRKPGHQRASLVLRRSSRQLAGPASLLMRDHVRKPTQQPVQAADRLGHGVVVVANSTGTRFRRSSVMGAHSVDLRARALGAESRKVHISLANEVHAPTTDHPLGAGYAVAIQVLGQEPIEQ